MGPYKTEPVIVERVWGGGRLRQYNKNLCKASVGESWETGELLPGTPILVKLIDANEALSIQVHPDDSFAAEVESAPNGKSEAWVILDCEEDAYIVYGFNRPVTKEELRAVQDEGGLPELLNCVKVRKGDCIYIPAGTVHSLGKGVLAYEVQQPSDLTYRLFDWDRKDVFGKKRELHLDKAVEAINYNGKLHQIRNIYDSLPQNSFDIIECEHFSSGYRRIENRKSHEYASGRHMVLTVISGSIILQHCKLEIDAKKGETCIIPRECEGMVTITGMEASEYIISTSNKE